MGTFEANAGQMKKKSAGSSSNPLRDLGSSGIGTKSILSKGITFVSFLSDFFDVSDLCDSIV